MSDVLVFCMDEKYTCAYHRIAGMFRAEGISSEVYPEGKKLGQQFSFAEKKGIPVGIFCGEEEIQSDTLTVKNLVTRENFEKLSREKAVAKIREILSSQ